MEERRTAVWVLGTLAIVITMAVYFWPIIYNDPKTISFKSCKVTFKYENSDFDQDIYRVSNNKLALCLCRLYQQKPSSVIGNKIMAIQKKFDRGSTYNHYTLDSVLRNKTAVFDTLLALD